MKNLKMKNRKRKHAYMRGGMVGLTDIALLLFVFFLVATNGPAEKGIAVKLPPPVDEIGIVCWGGLGDYLHIRLNAEGQLSARGELIHLHDLRPFAKTFISNPEGLPHLAEDPASAIVYLQPHRDTDYKSYIAALNEIRGAYHELWEEAARRRFDKGYTALPKALKKEIHMDIPLVVVEGEPL